MKVWSIDRWVVVDGQSSARHCCAEFGPAPKDESLQTTSWRERRAEDTLASRLETRHRTTETPTPVNPSIQKAKQSDEHLAHVRPVQLVPQPPVVIPRSNARNNGELPAAVLVPCDPLSLLHQKLTESLVLELFGVAPVHADGRSVDVLASASANANERRVSDIEAGRVATLGAHEFSNHTGAHSLWTADELLPERPFLRALSQPQQANEHVLLSVLVREERLPSTCRNQGERGQ